MRTIDMDEFLTVWDAGDANVVDVREPREYTEAHVPGALLIPLGQVAARAGEVPADEPVYVICRSGARSQRGAADLARAGRDAISVNEGTSVGSGGAAPWPAGWTPADPRPSGPARPTRTLVRSPGRSFVE